MPVSAAGHFPLVTSTSYPALTSYLTSHHNAQKVSNWSVSIKVLRSNHQSTSKEKTTSRPKLMYLVSLSEYPTETFVLVEDQARDTRASIKQRINTQRQQDILMNGDAILKPEAVVTSKSISQAISDVKEATIKSATRYTLYTASSFYPLLVSKLNLPPPLGAPSMGDGVTNNQTSAGPGAWLPRGSSIVIEGFMYELPSAMRYGIEEVPDSSNCEWRIKLGMLQSGANRNSGAILEAEYLPLLRLQDPLLILSQIQGFFPAYITDPTQDGRSRNINSASIFYPTPEQWEEVIPASNEAWLHSIDSTYHPDMIGWRGKERGRRSAYLYIMLLRHQGVL